MSEVVVRSVSTESERQAFLRMPWKVYADDPNWVAPLWKEHVQFFDPAHNVELKHIDMELFVAWRGTEPVGTIIAFVNHAYNEFQGENAGWFGQFEVLNDREAAHALLQAAESWLREKGVSRMLGPATFSTNSEIGLLVDGFDTPPMIMMTHARPYAHELVESYPGITKEMDLWAWYFHTDKFGGKQALNLPEKVVRVTEKVRQRRNFVLTKPVMREFGAWVEKLKRIYNRAWEKNWGFVPLSEEELDKLAKDLKPLVDPEIVRFVELNGEVIAFGAPVVNLYEPLRKVRCKPGEPEWWQLARLIWHWRIRGRVTSVRVFLLGVLEEHRGKGADAVLLYELLKSGLARGYRDVELSWILETNDAMNRDIELLGATRYKTYRVYQKALT
ncbi:MAG: GNAT family N-acetyltransferase [Anaerolineae bacterium]